MFSSPYKSPPNGKASPALQWQQSPKAAAIFYTHFTVLSMKQKYSKKTQKSIGIIRILVEKGEICVIMIVRPVIPIYG